MTLDTLNLTHCIRLLTVINSDFFSPFEAGSYYVAQADPELAILLLQSLRVRLQLWAITHSCKFRLVLNAQRQDAVQKVLYRLPFNPLTYPISPNISLSFVGGRLWPIDVRYKQVWDWDPVSLQSCLFIRVRRARATFGTNLPQTGVPL